MSKMANSPEMGREGSGGREGKGGEGRERKGQGDGSEMENGSVLYYSSR